MAKNEVKQAQQGRTFKWKDAECPSIYANQVGVGMTPFDIAIVFGEVLEADETNVTGLPRVKIILSPEQASNLKQILEVSLDHYSKSNGPLRRSGAVDPVDLLARIEEQTKKIH